MTLRSAGRITCCNNELQLGDDVLQLCCNWTSGNNLYVFANVRHPIATKSKRQLQHNCNKIQEAIATTKRQLQHNPQSRRKVKKQEYVQLCYVYGYGLSYGCTSRCRVMNMSMTGDQRGVQVSTTPPTTPLPHTPHTPTAHTPTPPHPHTPTPPHPHTHSPAPSHYGPLRRKVGVWGGVVG
jgi:hypothetical protein